MLFLVNNFLTVILSVNGYWFDEQSGVFTVIPAEAGVQGIQLITFWIALTLHCVSRPPPSRGKARGNDEGYKLKLPGPWIKYKCGGMKIIARSFVFSTDAFL